MQLKKLLTIGNAKTVKGEKLNYLTGVVYLAPSNLVDGINVCKFASVGCKAACLFTAGRGRFSNVQQARINKTIYFRDHQALFMKSIVKDIKALERKAKRENKTPTVRLNGTSDICFENIKLDNGNNIFEEFSHITFYDYTKDYTRLDALHGKWGNYHLTFSWAESKANNREALKLIDQGVNVAVVFDKKPESFRGRKVINGDEHDLRFLDDKNSIVGLSAKGDAKKDESGFVVREERVKMFEIRIKGASNDVMGNVQRL